MSFFLLFSSLKAALVASSPLAFFQLSLSLFASFLLRAGVHGAEALLFLTSATCAGAGAGAGQGAEEEESFAMAVVAVVIVAVATTSEFPLSAASGARCFGGWFFVASTGVSVFCCLSTRAKRSGDKSCSKGAGRGRQTSVASSSASLFLQFQHHPTRKTRPSRFALTSACIPSASFADERGRLEIRESGQELRDRAE